MLRVCYHCIPGVCCEGISYPHAHFPWICATYDVGIALTRSTVQVSYDLGDGRADVDTRVFCCVVQ